MPLEVGAKGALIPFPLVGLVDTGAPFTMLPADLAGALGVRIGRARRVPVAVAGTRGKLPLVPGFLLRLRSEDRDAGNREVVVGIATTALLVPDPVFYDFALLGQLGFLDRVDEFCHREQEGWFELRVRAPLVGAGASMPVEVRERGGRYRARRRRA